MARSERLLTLVFVMLNSPRGVTRERLRASIPDYADSPSEQAFERMFERDKESMREMGIPVETVQLDAYHDDEWGYRIDPRAYELPAVSFTTDELVALDLASRAWRQAALEGEAALALRKLESTGLELPEGGPAIPVEPRIGASEPAFADVLRAAMERREVTFEYRKPGSEQDARHVQPWGVLLRLGASYLIGHDVDRDAVRSFRVSRIQGTVTLGRPDAYTVPSDIDLRALLGDGEPEEISGEAVLEIEPGRAMGLRRLAGAEPHDRVVRLPFRSLDRLERDIAAHGPDIVVVEPAELRHAVVSRLRGSVVS